MVWYLTTLKGTVHILSDSEAKMIMKRQLTGNKFVFPIRENGEIVGTEPSHQISQILRADKYREKWIKTLRDNGKTLCRVCYHPKRTGSQCGNCGGNRFCGKETISRENKTLWLEDYSTLVLSNGLPAPDYTTQKAIR